MRMQMRAVFPVCRVLAVRRMRRVREMIVVRVLRAMQLMMVQTLGKCAEREQAGQAARRVFCLALQPRLGGFRTLLRCANKQRVSKCNAASDRARTCCVLLLVFGQRLFARERFVAVAAAERFQAAVSLQMTS